MLIPITSADGHEIYVDAMTVDKLLPAADERGPIIGKTALVFKNHPQPLAIDTDREEAAKRVNDAKREVYKLMGVARG